MAGPNQLHSFQRLMRSLIAIDYRSQFAGNIPDFYHRRIAPHHDYAPENIALGKHAKKFAIVIDYANGAYVFRRHKLRGVLHRCRGFHGIRLTISNDMSDEHHG
jgi:hypothetical protein